MDLLDKIKRLTVTALVADDLLVGILVLKSGNAIDLAYDLSITNLAVPTAQRR